MGWDDVGWDPNPVAVPAVPEDYEPLVTGTFTPRPPRSDPFLVVAPDRRTAERALVEFGISWSDATIVVANHPGDGLKLGLYRIPLVVMLVDMYRMRDDVRDELDHYIQTRGFEVFHVTLDELAGIDRGPGHAPMQAGCDASCAASLAHGDHWCRPQPPKVHRPECTCGCGDEPF